MDKQIPDSATVNRIKNLSEVGIALFEATNDASYQTNYYAAKEALKRFQEGINQLHLDEQSQDGMDKLIKYLDQKIDKRLEASL